jgi:CheY-like chemotaxis protein
MRTILLIDDDPHLLRVLQRVMRPYEHEWTLVTASDGREATRLVRRQAFDLILTDIHMPGKDGLEMIAEVRSALPQAKIMAMTGGSFLGGGNLLHIARVLGAHEVIQKPFDASKLIASMQALLGTAERPSDTSDADSTVV